jgi:nitroreductase/NAD-dependent dihydropyrimidine dehydrogenase PreA subunit
VVRVTPEKCTGCGFCADECPAGIFTLEPAPGGGRVALAGDPGLCSSCGHCVAICPEGAVVHEGLPADGFEDGPSVAIAPDAMRSFLLSRRSTRAFKKRPVPGELIEQLIEVGTHAGTASNAQTENFIVIRSPELLTELEGMVIDVLWNRLRLLGSGVGRMLARLKYGEEAVKQSMLYYERYKTRRETGQTEGMIFRGAPALIAVHGLRANLSARENCAIAARNMEMLAKSLGLGTCWAGFLLVAAGMTDKIAHRLGIPDDRNIYSAIMLGYPKHEYRKRIPRRQREVRWL